jgi:hypothetical protein
MPPAKKIICFLLLLLVIPHSKNRIICAQEKSSQVFNLRVLYVVVNPVEGDKNLYEDYISWLLGGKTADQFTDYWANQYINSFKRLSKNTINYIVAKKLQVTTVPRHTRGTEYTLETYFQNCWPPTPGSYCESHAEEIDYPAFINDNDICGIANRENIDEIWVMAPYALQSGEDYVIGPSYGPRTNGPAVIVDSCQKLYNLTVANVDCPYNFMESYAHRVETQMIQLVANWLEELKNKYWYNFYLIETTGGPFCGNAHFPPNFTHGYDFANSTYATSTCPDWKNFPDLKGETEYVNCQAWGCDNVPWQEYWLGSLPRSDGWVEIINNMEKKTYFKKNWWYYLLYPENIINYIHNIPFSPEGLNYSISNNTATLNWEAVPDAGRYALRVNDLTDSWDGSCSSPAGDFCQDNLTNNSYSFPISAGHRYQWWIHAVNNYGSSSGSFGLEFSTPVPGDYDGNGKVNDYDLRFLLDHWNKSEADLTILLAHWQP